MASLFGVWFYHGLHHWHTGEHFSRAWEKEDIMVLQVIVIDGQLVVDPLPERFEDAMQVMASRTAAGDENTSDEEDEG